MKPCGWISNMNKKLKPLMILSRTVCSASRLFWHNSLVCKYIATHSPQRLSLSKSQLIRLILGIIITLFLPFTSRCRFLNLLLKPFHPITRWHLFFQSQMLEVKAVLPTMNYILIETNTVQDHMDLSSREKTNITHWYCMKLWKQSKN